MKVKNKDRKTDIEIFRMALNLCEIGADYPTADLIDRIYKNVKKKKGDFNLKNGVELLHQWMRDWEEYEAIQNENRHT